MIGCCSLKFRRERQKQLAAEQIIGAVGVCRAAGDDVRVDDRRILVEHIIGAGANLQDLVDVPRGLEVQIIIGRDSRVVIVVSAERRKMQRRIPAVVVLRYRTDETPSERCGNIPGRLPGRAE